MEAPVGKELENQRLASGEPDARDFVTDSNPLPYQPFKRMPERAINSDLFCIL